MRARFGGMVAHGSKAVFLGARRSAREIRTLVGSVPVTGVHRGGRYDARSYLFAVPLHDLSRYYARAPCNPALANSMRGLTNSHPATRASCSPMRGSNDSPRGGCDQAASAAKQYGGRSCPIDGASASSNPTPCDARRAGDILPHALRADGTGHHGYRVDPFWAGARLLNPFLDRTDADAADFRPNGLLYTANLVTECLALFQPPWLLGRYQVVERAPNVPPKEGVQLALLDRRKN